MSTDWIAKDIATVVLSSLALLCSLLVGVWNFYSGRKNAQELSERTEVIDVQLRSNIDKGLATVKLIASSKRSVCLLGARFEYVENGQIAEGRLWTPYAYPSHNIKGLTRLWHWMEEAGSIEHVRMAYFKEGNENLSDVDIMEIVCRDGSDGREWMEMIRQNLSKFWIELRWKWKAQDNMVFRQRVCFDGLSKCPEFDIPQRIREQDLPPLSEIGQPLELRKHLMPPLRNSKSMISTAAEGRIAVEPVPAPSSPPRKDSPPPGSPAIGLMRVLPVRSNVVGTVIPQPATENSPLMTKEIN